MIINKRNFLLSTDFGQWWNDGTWWISEDKILRAQCTAHKKQLLKSSQNKKFEAPIVFSTFCYSEVSHCHTATVLKLEVSHCVTNTTITTSDMK